MLPCAKPFVPLSHGGTDPDRPRAAIAVTGAAGSGKTKLAAVLAETLYPGENALLRFDMREYSDYSAVNTLTGLPGGFCLRRKTDRSRAAEAFCSGAV